MPNGIIYVVCLKSKVKLMKVWAASLVFFSEYTAMQSYNSHLCFYKQQQLKAATRTISMLKRQGKLIKINSIRTYIIIYISKLDR